VTKRVISAAATIARRPTQSEHLAALMVHADGIINEQDADEINGLIADSGADGSDYITNMRPLRLVGDGIEPAVFSDGRGNGSWELYCWYCGVKGTHMVQDHMLSRALRGSDDASNLVSACRDCNAAKGSRSVEGFRALLEHLAKVSVCVFAGECGLCVMSGSRFSYLQTLSPGSRREYLAASLARKNPDPPAPSIGDLFKNNPAKGLL